MRKFVFVGAGSLDFTRDLVRDLMTFPAFDDCELMLMDIDEKRLRYAKQGVERIVRAGGHHAKVSADSLCVASEIFSAQFARSSSERWLI